MKQPTAPAGRVPILPPRRAPKLRPLRSERWVRFGLGAGGMALALALTYVVRRLLGAVPYPPAIIQDVLRTLAPGKLDQVAIRGLQHWAQRLLYLGIHLALLAVAGYLATLFAPVTSPPRRARWGIALGGALFAAASILALAGDEGSSWYAFVVYLFAAYLYARLACGTGFLTVLDPEIKGEESPLDAIRRSRRSFLGRGAVAAGVVLLGGGALVKALFKRTAKVTIVPAAQPFVNPGPDPNFPAVAGLTPEITANGDFYNVDIDFIKPSLDANTWTLTVGGAVNGPFVLTFHQLQTEFEVVEVAHTLSCISNEVGGDLVGTAIWRGVRFSDVLNRAGLKPGVVEIVSKAADGFSDSVPLSRAMQPDSLVVFGMNGEQLPIEHGFPVRIIIPGLYGMKQPKWVQSVEAVTKHYNGYWEVRGWDEQAVMVTQSRIDVPQGGSRVGQASSLAGIAWAGDKGISKVEVSYDSGATWHAALLKRELSPVTWRMWAIGITAPRGPARVMVRATDGTGAVQTADIAEPDPGPATGWDFVTFQVT
ncbi:MAG TPA: molybdopterin-dependent oxidoreductase [Actinomycetota bacterium]|nr:molybdopterin-dependent oxidoreductase [Actinomycetota bacterium]